MRLLHFDNSQVWVANVDDDACCRHVSCHDVGEPNPINAILADAATHCTTGIILAQNTPRGDLRPSKSDLHSTQQLAEALDCAVIDYLIFAGGKCASLRRLGYL